jgi:hypothetical protein
MPMLYPSVCPTFCPTKVEILKEEDMDAFTIIKARKTS